MGRKIDSMYEDLVAVDTIIFSLEKEAALDPVGANITALQKELRGHQMQLLRNLRDTISIRISIE
ncbi:hypothetical protein [Marinomonas transparens]|uniref:Uncharacterized protein n=1 Tax=Marinomonas transparens TaxID=2795388 RepID=A0A934JJK8_9GAMM|nr:hypothetical protein [Marinomonas transparens]MBJ7536986.1 hypothetical protein [Marinomonas transparens]